jgi:hypothetical protein
MPQHDGLLGGPLGRQVAGQHVQADAEGGG